jgi:hypothetical protein
MMNDVGYWPEVRLLPIEGSTRSPLRRILARTAWQRSPLASISYEPGRDQLLIQLVDAPTIAEAIPGDSDDHEWPPVTREEGEAASWDEGGQFAGFDGTEPYAWPTMITVLSFSRCGDSDGPRIRLVRELCGDRIWTAARSAVHHPRRGLLEVPLGQDLAEFLIRRWQAILTPPSATGMTGPAMPDTLAEETSADPSRPVHGAQSPGDRATTLHGMAGHRGGQPGREP